MTEEERRRARVAMWREGHVCTLDGCLQCAARKAEIDAKYPEPETT